MIYVVKKKSYVAEKSLYKVPNGAHKLYKILGIDVCNKY